MTTRYWKDDGSVVGEMVDYSLDEAKNFISTVRPYYQSAIQAAEHLLHIMEGTALSPDQIWADRSFWSYMDELGYDYSAENL
jgi:hypothetical protein